MGDADIAPAVELLTVGFPERGAAYWRRALDRLARRDVPTDLPRYGYVMTDRGRLVGIILTLYAETDDGDVRGNVSSWYVDQAYRGFSHLLLAMPLKRRDLPLINISPSPATFATIEAQGFTPYVEGAVQVLAVLARPVPGARVRRVTATTRDAPRLLTEHADWGCLSFEITHRGTRHPFVFVPTSFVGGRLRCAQLVYCRSLADFTRFAGPLGRHLLRHGLPVVVVDSNRPLAGVPGLYRAGRGRKVFRGTVAPRLGDLSFTELAIFGP